MTSVLPISRPDVGSRARELRRRQRVTNLLVSHPIRMKGRFMYASPGKLPSDDRERIATSLNERLMDGIVTEFEKHAWFLLASVEPGK